MLRKKTFWSCVSRCLKTGFFEFGLIVFDWMKRRRKDFDEKDFTAVREVFEKVCEKLGSL